MQPAQTVLTYTIPNGTSYIDLAEGLSQVNRRAYRQGMEYAVGKVTFGYQANPQAILNVVLATYTAGNTWSVHNAWKKAYAHWIAQQRRTRRLIGQSAKPTWEDFKVYLDDAHRAGTSLGVLAGDGGLVGTGEWDYSRLLWEADDNSVDEVYMHLIGGNVGSSPNETDWGLVLNYQESRATVQPEDPDLPDEYSNNMYAKLATDENVVADEVAENMEDENDEPPYDQDDYPGGDTNSDAPWLQDLAIASTSVPVGVVPGFVAQCGLIKFELQAHAVADGGDTTAPSTVAMVHLVPGNYKGVAALPMGQ